MFHRVAIVNRGEAGQPHEQERRALGDREGGRPGGEQQASPGHAEQTLPRRRQPARMRRQRSADEGGAERRQRQRERCCMQLPGELERRARLGELAGGQHDSDPQNAVEREDRRDSRARGHREARPVRARTPATPDEPVETGHEPEQQRQVQRLLADRDRDRDPVLRVPGEHLLDRVPVGGRSGHDKHRVLDRHRRCERDRRRADNPHRRQPGWTRLRHRAGSRIRSLSHFH